MGKTVFTEQIFRHTVTLLVFLLMLVAAVLIWIGRGRNPIDSSVLARLHDPDLCRSFCLSSSFAGSVAFACYGLVLFLKMSKVRSERASSEMWKVAGLAVVSVLCFTLSELSPYSQIYPIRGMTERGLQLICSTKNASSVFFYTFSICAMADERTTTSTCISVNRSRFSNSTASAMDSCCKCAKSGLFTDQMKWEKVEDKEHKLFISSHITLGTGNHDPQTRQNCSLAVERQLIQTLFFTFHRTSKPKREYGRKCRINEELNFLHWRSFHSFIDFHYITFVGFTNLYQCVLSIVDAGLKGEPHMII
uniref:Uncharacterized protein n=1 Tax=Solanum lycopersicum TaxID=4081 RepID=A0A3Q7F2M4_SOLLC